MTPTEPQDITAQLYRIEERLNEILAAIRASKPQTWPEQKSEEEA